MTADIARVRVPDHGATAQRPPRRLSWLIVLGAAVGGVAVGRAAVPGDRGGSATAGRAAPIAASRSAPSPSLSVDDWLARAASAGGRAPAPELRQALVQALADSPSLRRAVVERYGRATGPLRTAMRELLAATSAPELPAAAIDLASRTDHVQRAAGFELLALLAPSDRAYALARHAIANETDADALAGGVMALRSPGPASQAEARAVLPRLIELTAHPDALVRAHAVQQVADWDKTGELAMPIVLRACSDAERVVRQAAVGAVMIGQLRSDGLKQALLRILDSSAEEPMTAAGVLQALERFSLTDDELSRYLAKQRELARSATARSTR